MTTVSSSNQTLAIEQAIALATAQHRSCQPHKAEEIYRAILQIDPGHPEANYNLGLLALDAKQADPALTHMAAALEADPTRGKYWLSYIDTLFQAGQTEAARQVLALARQQGLEGEEVERLARQLESVAAIKEQPDPKPQQGQRESRPSPPAYGRNGKNTFKSKPSGLNRPGKHSAAHKRKEPSPQATSLLASLFNEGRFAKAATLAQDMTLHFPSYGFGWKVLGAALQQTGQNAPALMPMQKAAALLRDDAEVHSNLGLTLMELGRLGEAETSCRQALTINPDLAPARLNLGLALQELGRLEEAAVCLRQALEINPNWAEAYNGLGNVLATQGRLGEAEASLRRALEIDPDFAVAHRNLGIILRSAGRLEEGEACCRRALRIRPDYADAHSTLGAILHDLGRLEEAEVSDRRALEANPESAEMHNNLGTTLYSADRLDEAEKHYRKALSIKADLPDAQCNLGNTLKNLGRLDEARASYLRAQELGSTRAGIRHAFMLPAIMGARPEMLECRSHFERNLDSLHAEHATLDDPLMSVGETNFYLAYHGLNDRDLQIKVAKFYEQACPSLLYTAPHCLKPRPETQGKIRIGFFSKFLYGHSVSFCFSKIIEGLSSNEDFEVTLLSSQAIDETIYREFAGKRVRLPNALVPAREAVAGLELDILVYLDIGMEPLGYFLAFSRLARTQCVLPGHPVTTGIGNMDFFVSSTVIEPLDADEHYSETLICLNRPLFYISRPSLPEKLKTREELGLPVEKHLFVCPMKLQKLHPDFDAAISRLLQLDPDGVVVLFEDHTYPHWKTELVRRFENTIPGELRERIIFMPWLKDPVDFISAIAAADVVLDPFHFGIGSTVAMTALTGTPIVTKAGEFMRGRVGAYCCELLGVAECIAEDTEKYARKAVEIARSPALRSSLSASILKNNSGLYDNLQCVEDLSDFFYSARDGWHVT